MITYCEGCPAREVCTAETCCDTEESCWELPADQDIWDQLSTVVLTDEIVEFVTQDIRNWDTCITKKELKIRNVIYKVRVMDMEDGYCAAAVRVLGKRGKVKPFGNELEHIRVFDRNGGVHTLQNGGAFSWQKGMFVTAPDLDEYCGPNWRRVLKAPFMQYCMANDIIEWRALPLMAEWLAHKGEWFAAFSMETFIDALENTRLAYLKNPDGKKKKRRKRRD